MIGIKKKENDRIAVDAERENFLSILTVLYQILKDSENTSQAEFIYKLIELINVDDIDQFIKSINGVNMWGGSGSVWEVNILNKYEMDIFASYIIKLINLMDKIKILGKGVLSIKYIFENITK
jgi:hypothetical protein